MSIKDASKRASSETRKRKYQVRLAVPQSAIRDFIASLSTQEVGPAAARLQIVADTTRYALDNKIAQLEESDLQMLDDLAGESDNKFYQRIMRAIIACVARGPIGIDSAHTTASRVVVLAFRYTSDYFSALDRYRNKLRRMRRATKNRRIKRQERAVGGDHPSNKREDVALQPTSTQSFDKPRKVVW